MRISLRHFAVLGLAAGCSLGMIAETPVTTAKPAAVAVPAAQAENVTNPVADPKAVVVVGNARFTVLTPQLIRMEWAADGKFEDHASFVFINRRMPVPKFTVAHDGPAESGYIDDQNRCAHVGLFAIRRRTLHARKPLTSNSQSMAKRSSGILASKIPKICKAPRVLSTAHAATRPRSPSSRVWFHALAGRWLTTQHAHSSTPPTSASCKAKRARGPGLLSAPPETGRTCISSATATTTARHLATMSASPAAFRCRRVLLSARGGRAIGTTATRSWMN